MADKEDNNHENNTYNNYPKMSDNDESSVVEISKPMQGKLKRI